MSEGLFCTKQTSQFHPGGGFRSPNPVEELVEEEVVVVVVMVVEEDGETVVCCGASSGEEPVCTGEAKPNTQRR